VSDLLAYRVQPSQSFFPRQPDRRSERTTRLFLHGRAGFGGAPSKCFKHCIIDVSDDDLAHNGISMCDIIDITHCGTSHNRRKSNKNQRCEPAMKTASDSSM
jgi:hypothetical protein